MRVIVHYLSMIITRALLCDNYFGGRFTPFLGGLFYHTINNIKRQTPFL